MSKTLESAAVLDDKRDILEYMKKFRLEEVLNDVSKYIGFDEKQFESERVGGCGCGAVKRWW